MIGEVQLSRFKGRVRLVDDLLWKGGPTPAAQRDDCSGARRIADTNRGDRPGAQLSIDALLDFNRGHDIDAFAPTIIINDGKAALRAARIDADVLCAHRARRGGQAHLPAKGETSSIASSGPCAEISRDGIGLMSAG